MSIPVSSMDATHTKVVTHFLEMFVLLIASKPIHSTLALSHALHAGSLPSHFCFRDLHRVQLEIALATLYVDCPEASVVVSVGVGGCDGLELFDFGLWGSNGGCRDFGEAAS